MRIRKVKAQYTNGYFSGTVIVGDNERVGDVVCRRRKLNKRDKKSLKIIESRRGSLYDISLTEVTPEEFDIFLKDFYHMKVS